jgi:16S rRNA (guanine527-N7)-methyltransferase
VFGEGLAKAEAFVRLLEEQGVLRGLIGPREVPKLWERHVLNSAVIGEGIAEGASVIDIGSGAGFPAIPLVIARPDLDVTVIEPMQRRIDWLTEVNEKLELGMTVVRGRAEEKVVRKQVEPADVVTSRAVAPLDRLASWSLPLTRIGGYMLALKGMSVQEEFEEHAKAIARFGGAEYRVEQCGVGVLEVPTTVAIISRVELASERSKKKRR